MSTTVPAQNAGTAVYFPLFLNFYDTLVLWFNNNFVWKCPTMTTQLPLFRQALGRRHLDIGVGTGFYPAHAVPGSACRELTLMDLNPNALAKAKGRVEGAVATTSNPVSVKTVIADATATLPLPADAQFDSISLFFLLHCIPGPPSRKNNVFAAVRPHLSPEGVLVGTTVLGAETPYSWIAWQTLRLYNWKGVFDNWADTANEFEAGLRREFEEVDVRVEGSVLLFTARRPRV